MTSHPDCGNTLPSKNMDQEHLCRECDVVFTTYPYLLQHWADGKHSDPLYEYRRNPNVDYPWDVIKPRCRDCRVIMTKETWNEHHCIQSGKVARRWKCRACDEHLFTLAARAHHERYTHKNKYFACGICQLPFTYRHELVHHNRVHHRADSQHDEGRSVPNAAWRPAQTVPEPQTVTEPSPVNTRKSSEADVRTQHQRRRDEIQREDRRARAKSQQARWRSEHNHHQDTRRSRSTNSQNELQGRESERQERIAKAAEQQAQWRKDHTDRQNTKSDSTGDQSYSCKICSKSFARQGNLVNHKQKHAINIQNECSECGKVFSNRFTLKRHAVQHGGSAPPLKRQRMSDPRDHYTITKINTIYSEKFSTTNTKYKVMFRDMGEEDSLEEILATLHNVLSSLIEDITQSTNPDDIIHLTIVNPELDFPISIPFTRQYNLNANTILQEIEKVLQSYKEFILDNTLEINYTHIAVPEGSGKKRGIVNLDKFLEKKKCIIRIQNKKDDLCLARSLVVAIARLNKSQESQWGSIRKGRGIQKDLALKLHSDANVQLGPCGITEVKQFQTYLSDYQINVISKEHFNTIIYSGPEAEHRIYIYHHDKHYDVITSMPAFFGSSYWCVNCTKPYENPETHSCIDVCSCCRKIHEESGEEPWISCDDCNRVFKGETCFDLHIRVPGNGSSICQNFHKCRSCGKTIDQRKQRDHKCGTILCKVCKEYVESGHLCYIKTVEEENTINKETKEPLTNIAHGLDHDTNDEDTSYIFFDFETIQDNDIHEPNLCVAHKVCGTCIDIETDSCEKCGERQHIFYGERAREDFCEWLFAGNNTGATCIAHNSKGFDSYFILKYLHDNCVIPYIIFNGAKIMSMTIKKCKIRFIDSINFTPMSLAKLPAAFGLTSIISKGYFPHYYNTKANQDNVLYRLPNKSYYCPESMKKEELDKFNQWYADHKNDKFDLKSELIKYCVSDVDILRRCCLQFRRQFMAMTSIGAGDPGIDPYKQCITIASACQLVFRTKFLTPKTIAIIPHHGYHPEQNQSIKAMQWIMYYTHTEGVNIQHARNGKEFKIGPYHVDGYYEKDGKRVVLEFLGNFWHGNPTCYSKDTINPVNEKTMGELYETTVQRKRYIEEQGYTVIEMWESTWDKLVNENDTIRQFVNSLEFVEALNPRDAFYTEDERAFVGTWVSVELKLAVNKGYRILKIYEVWNFTNVEQYNPTTKSGGLFSGYIDMFVKMKQEASGFPEWCNTESDKRRYITDYMDREGVRLDYHNITKNPGLRSLAKLMLTSFWGKFGERCQRTKTLYTPDPAVYFDYLTSSSIEVRSARLVSAEVAELQYQNSDEFVESGTRSNVIIAAYTTAHARLKLYSLLDSLGKRTLYADTDSAIYSTRRGETDPPLGDLLGQLTSEIPPESSHISLFCTGSAKSYAYKLAKPDKHGNAICCKVRTL